MLIPSKELEQERHLPCYQICHQTAMNAYKWNTSRVTVREGNKSILSQELSILSHLSHPQLLLMMGQTEAEDLRIVFEPVMIGSLFQCLHQFHMKVGIFLLVNLGKPPKKISQQLWTMGVGSANFCVWTSKKCFFRANFSKNLLKLTHNVPFVCLYT